MPPKRKPAAKKTETNHWGVPTTRTREVVADMNNTINSLRMQRAHARTVRVHAAEEAAVAPAPVRPIPPVLTSVVKFRDGELESMQANLINPMMDFYATEPLSHALTAVLVERKNASSQDVNVRLFFANGEELAYLWPSTHSKDGVWTPPCARDVATATIDLPLCSNSTGTQTNVPQ